MDTTLNLTDPLTGDALSTDAAALPVSRLDLAGILAGVENKLTDEIGIAVEEALGGRDFSRTLEGIVEDALRDAFEGRDFERAVEAAVEDLTDQVETLTSRLAELTKPTTFRSRLLWLATGKVA